MLKISEEEKTAIDAAAKANRNKRAAKRLEVLQYSVYERFSDRNGKGVSEG